MMKIAYFDCFSGISGDMLVGALIDAGVNIGELQSELNRLQLDGYRIESKKTERHHISATKFEVHIDEDASEEPHSLQQILKIIDTSNLSMKIKNQAKNIFNRLAHAESKVHNLPVEDTHLHELGAIDALVDVVGTLIGLELLGVQEVYASKLNEGRGFVKCAHGIIPVPAPATAELTKGIPLQLLDIEAELVTPTGAAIITTLAKEFGYIPTLKVESIGYGAGSRNLDTIPNLLRVLIGYVDTRYQTDTITALETNIDDLNPQLYDYLLDRLLSNGALDAFLTPVIMKKSRPAVLLTVLAETSMINTLSSIIFEETTTLGLRISHYERNKLHREIAQIDTPYGKIRVKIATTNQGIKRYYPEYEDCRQIAISRNIPLSSVYKEISEIVEETLKDKDT